MSTSPVLACHLLITEFMISKDKDILNLEIIKQRILLIRGHKVMIDADLAELYNVKTSILNKAVSRNTDRFPDDFAFRLTKKEFDNLMFHFGTSRWGGTRKMPRVFTEQGVAMLSSVLRSKRAIHVNIAIMRAFVQLRLIISTNKELAKKLNQLEEKVEKHDGEIRSIFEAIRQLINPKVSNENKRIGFEL